MTLGNINLSIVNQYVSATQDLIKSKNYDKYINKDSIEIQFSIDENNEENSRVRISAEITNILTQIIKDVILKDYVNKSFRKNYIQDLNLIYSHAIELFNKKENLIKESIFYRVYDYINKDNYINLDGFVKFRMKDLYTYISKISDIALEEYLIKKDQNEFVSVLRYFIDAQDEKIDILKVYILKDRTFVLCDKDDKVIDNVNDEYIMNMILKENLNYEDFLISTLLTLCPRKIIISDDLNNNESKELIDMVESIFGEKVQKATKN